MVATGRAFQDGMPENHCFGCGACNEDGFRLKSYWDGERAVAEWMPRPEHMAGPTHVLNGGVIATLLDCHTICTAVADAYRREGREVGEGERIWYVTASLDIRYQRPTAIDLPVRLSAEVDSIDGKKTIVTARLDSDGKERASCRVLAVRVDERWLAAPA